MMTKKGTTFHTVHGQLMNVHSICGGFDTLATAASRQLNKYIRKYLWLVAYRKIHI